MLTKTRHHGMGHLIRSTPIATHPAIFATSSDGQTDIITKTRLYNFDPLKPHFYIVKLGFTGVYIIFLIFAQNIDCGYSLEPPRRGGSNGYPQSMFLSRNKKNNEDPCKPKFYHIKVGFKGIKIIQVCFRDGLTSTCTHSFT